MYIGKGDSTGQFCIDGIPLPVVTECHDLGITITHDLSHSSHISDIIFKTHQRANLIHRCFVSRNPKLLVRAFVTYVRPLLEYNALFGLPIQKQDISITLDEQVQRRFTKRLQGYSGCSYENRLQLLNLQTLEIRRIWFDLIWCYRIVFGTVRVIPDQCRPRGPVVGK